MEDNFNKIINGVKNDLLKIKRKNQSEICKSKPKKIRLDHRYFQWYDITDITTYYYLKVVWLGEIAKKKTVEVAEIESTTENVDFDFFGKTL